jgi:hypothetical protein
MKQPNLFKASISAKQMADAVKTLGTSMEVIIVSLQKVVHSMKQMKKK